MARQAEPRSRRRLPAVEARREILAAARERLLALGPRGVTLKDIAGDVGISHQAILHHFGSREGLLREVVGDALNELSTSLVAAFEQHDGPLDARVLLDQVDEVFEGQGQARLMAWLLLDGLAPPDDPGQIREIARALDARRRDAGRDSDPEQTLFTVLLVGILAFGDAIVGESMRRSAGLGSDDAARARFRAWVRELVVDRLA